MQLSPEHLCRLAAGRLTGSGDGAAPLAGISTDSREVVPGGAFVAVAGEREDGHAYLADAVRRGALLGLVAEGRELGTVLPALLLRVDDTAVALRRACTARLEELGCAVVGVTGSVGKTTAKEMIAHVLAAGLRTGRTPGNLNTWTGVPCSVLSADGPLDAYVVEMAMSAPGEIRDLAQTCRPRLGVLLNVGVSHIELLGSREAIAEAKGELLDLLPEDGLAVLNADDELVRSVAVRSGAPVAWFGLSAADAAYSAREVRSDGLDGTRFRLVAPGGDAAARLRAPGTHLVRAACAAAAVAVHLGLDLATVAQRLESFSAPQQRGTVLTGPAGSTLYDDSYNSAPDSLAAALEVLAASGSARRVAVIGDMLELGSESIAAHAQAGRQAAHAATDVVAVGGHGARVVAAAIDSGLPADAAWAVRDADEAVDVVLPLLDAGTTVLVKGSHGLHLERVVERLAAAAAAESA